MFLLSIGTSSNNKQIEIQNPLGSLGHELLDIFLRYTRNLLSTLDPVSLSPCDMFRLSIPDAPQAVVVLRGDNSLTSFIRVPSAGIEPASPPSEGGILSIERQGGIIKI